MSLSLSLPIRKIYFANFNDEQRIFNPQIIQYSKLILVINNIVYLWPWISKIFHENCKQISKIYPWIMDNCNEYLIHHFQYLSFMMRKTSLAVYANIIPMRKMLLNKFQ
jgi:hypothetical protein